MSEKQYLENLKGDKPKHDEIMILVRDYENQLIKLIKAIGDTANPGHSFPVVIDPGDSEHEQKFYFDGDGAFYIKNVKINGKEYKEDK
jgi:hypothetical protein